MRKIEVILTSWFRGDTHPERIGVYQRNFGREKKYSYWDGRQWRLGASTPEQAELEQEPSSVQLQIPSVVWRGLAEEQK